MESREGDEGRLSTASDSREELPPPQAEPTSVLPLEVPKSEPREVASRTDRGGKPWGFWATVGFGILIMVVWSVAQGFAGAVLTGRRVTLSDMLARGWLFAWMTILSAPVAVGGSVVLAGVRKGIGVSVYLGLEWPRVADVRRWVLILLGLIAAMDSLSWALGRPVVPEPMMPMFRTAGSLPIVLLALVVAAPLAEEFLFRGFIFTGLRNSRLGPIGAIVLTALAFGGLHIQYDAYGMAAVIVGGILFGLVRWRTGSLWLCVLMHGLMNVIATIEALIIISRG